MCSGSNCNRLRATFCESLNHPLAIARPRKLGNCCRPPFGRRAKGWPAGVRPSSERRERTLCLPCRQFLIAIQAHLLYSALFCYPDTPPARIYISQRFLHCDRKLLHRIYICLDHQSCILKYEFDHH